MTGHRKPVTFFIICLLLAMGVPGSSPLLAQDEETAEAAEDTLGWPRDLDTERGVVTVYQPQIESFVGDILEARAAVSVKEKGKDDPPVFGAVWLKARMATDMDTRLVTLASLEVPNAKFPNASDEDIQKLQTFLEAEIPKWDMTMELDRLLASVYEIEERRKASDNLNNDPPEIIYRNKAAVLVLIDGDPKLTDLEGYDLQIVVNTAFFIVQDKSKRYYLKGGANWFTSMDLLKDWEATTELPKEVVEVAKRIAEDEKKEKEKEKEENPELAADVEREKEEIGEPEVPEIFVRTKPAELVTTYGEPEMASIEGTELLYVKNSESDIVMDITSQRYYLLLSGRWFRSPSLGGTEWEFVAFEELPEEFEKIPSTSDMSTVLMSVPGTDEAKEAVLENDIPQTAEVSRADAKLEVKYDGDPTFETCTDNGVSYAVNTDKAVLLIDGTYYACDDAIWFVGKGPEGPWVVADEVPEKVQDIPPECPVYNVKYVYIYESTPEVVYVGYTPGYVGSYYYGGCVVYGTGYWYHPWYATYYYPHPVTYGYGVHYAPYTGWGLHVGVRVGWLAIGVAWGRPWYGGWYGGCWGAAGYRAGYRHGYHHGYHHGYRHGARAGYRAGYRAGSRHNNVYRNRSTGVKQTGTRNRAQAGGSPGRGSASQRPSTGQQRPSTGQQRPSTGQKTPQRSNKSNNVYTDRSGNVSRNQGGSWQQSNGKGGWNSGGSSNRSSQQQLNKSQQSRSRGTTRSQGASRSRSGGGSRGGGGGRRR